MSCLHFEDSITVPWEKQGEETDVTFKTISQDSSTYQRHCLDKEYKGDGMAF